MVPPILITDLEATMTYVCSTMVTLSPLSDLPASVSTPASTLIVRPEQGPFTDAKKAFMLPYLKRYLAASSAHGDKKKWVRDNVYPEFLKNMTLQVLKVQIYLHS